MDEGFTESDVKALEVEAMRLFVKLQDLTSTYGDSVTLGASENCVTLAFSDRAVVFRGSDEIRSFIKGYEFHKWAESDRKNQKK